MKQLSSQTRLLITARSGSRVGLWGSLEKYAYGRLQNAPIDWKSVGIGAIGLSLVLSVYGGYYNSPTLGADRVEIVKKAAELGDYQLAQGMFEQIQDSASTRQVLGANTDLEELVYPERRVEREKREWEAQNEKYPGHRDILLNLALLSGLTGETEKESEYYEQARVLDPNGNSVQEIREIID